MEATIGVAATALAAMAGAAALILTGWLLERPRRADMRGIALQTVIVMVVLLAIAGTVAGVLLSKSSDVTNQLENTSIGIEAGNYTHPDLCRRANHVWGDGTGTTTYAAGPPVTHTASATGWTHISSGTSANYTGLIVSPATANLTAGPATTGCFAKG